MPPKDYATANRCSNNFITCPRDKPRHMKAKNLGLGHFGHLHIKRPAHSIY